MTDTDWSFSLRSATSGFLDDADSDGDNEWNVGDSRTYSCLSSNSSQTLQQIDLAAREDTAQYKPNPWSIARINAASRPQQLDTTITTVSKKPAAKKPPQGAIVDAFKRQAQKPNTKDSSAHANRRQPPSQKPALTSAVDVPSNSVSIPARSPTPIAHITSTSANPLPIPSQPRIPQQYQETLPSPFLPRKAFPTSHPSPSTRQSQNPHITHNLKPAQPISSPGPPPQPQHHVSGLFRSQPTPPRAPAYIGPHIIEARNITPNKAHIGMDCVVAPTTPADQRNARLMHRPHPKYSHTPAKLGMEPVLPAQRTQHVQPSRPRSNQPTIKASPKSEMVTPSPSFDQARSFFECPAPPGTASEQPWAEPPPREDSRLTPSPPRLRTTSPPRKRADPYDQLPPSPDSEWSTLKPQTRTAKGKGRSKASDVKSGKFRLPLSLGNLTPKEPPQKKARVITYLPPPPPKKQNAVAESHLGTRGICMDAALCRRYSVCFTFVPSISSISKSEISDGRVALSAALGRNGSAELAYACSTVRFKRCTHTLQTRPGEDPSGTHA